MSLVLAFASRTVDQRVVSPLLYGSHPYPYGSPPTVFVFQYKPLNFKKSIILSCLILDNYQLFYGQGLIIHTTCPL